MANKFVGKFARWLQNKSGDLEVTFTVENKMYIKNIEQLEENVDLNIQVTKHRSPRSLEQNNYMWALLAEIAATANGDTDEWNVYLMALDQYSSKFEYVMALPEAQATLEENFRAVKVMATGIEHNGRLFNSYKCFIGSSKMDTKEMTILIDGILDMAAKCGIDTAYWTEVLK